MKIHRAAATGLVASLVLLFISCATTPESSTKASDDEISLIQKEIEVGQAAFAKISGKYGLSHDRDTTRFLNLYLKSLSLYANRQGLEFTAGILENDQVNAYSLPGGYVLVTRGLLQRIRSPGALAGVLAHELGHIDLRHILENVKLKQNNDFWETLARIIAGPRQIITASMDQINQQLEDRLFIEGHAAKDEFSADAYAVKLLQSLNISAEPYRDLLQELSTEGKVASLENLDKTHPPLNERLAAIESLIIPGLPELSASAEFTDFISRVNTSEESK